MSTTKEKSRRKSFTLPNKKVRVEFIPRATAMIQEEDHVLFGGLAPNAYKGFQIPMAASGGLAVIFSDEELRTLENLMGYPEHALSILREKDNYWHDYYIKLDKNLKNLDLSQPQDYIFYKVALAQTDFVAPSHAKKRASSQWVIVDEEAEIKDTEIRVNMAKKAFMLLGKYENSKSELRHILMEAKGGSRIPEGRLNDLAFLQREAGKLAESDPTVFVRCAEDPDLEFKAAVYMGVTAKAIKRKGRYYYHLDDEKFSLPGDSNDLKGAVAFLKAPENSEFYLKLIDQINNSM